MSLSDKLYANAFYKKEDVREAVKNFKERTCYPNKPINTFEYAREILIALEEEFGEELSK